ncbi:hypothetical protein CASFOL_022046 [Castilleja foliolosa]|uniref:At1g61320/AtMIF1 LRR domain-containing protein n=1 Tax=Castilleja foliolosa TaxID=1961234 RepID=A0ABD3CZ76_9LAMI
MNKHSVIDDDAYSLFSPKKTQFELVYYPNHGAISGTAASLLSFVSMTIASPEKNEFWPFVDKTLQGYLDQNLSLQHFLVNIYNEVDLVDFVLLQKWIPIVIMIMCVKSLNLIFHRSTEGKDFPLPLLVFQSESLVELHLQGCDLSTLESTDNVMLNNLRTLRLHELDITDEVFEKIISETFDNFSSFFPCLNELRLNECKGLEEIKWESKILLLWYKLIVTPSEKDTTAWFLKLNKLLKALSQSHITLSLDPYEYKKLHINGSYGGFYKPVLVEHLKFASSSEPSILNCFFHICRPMYIHMDLPPMTYTAVNQN